MEPVPTKNYLSRPPRGGFLEGTLHRQSITELKKYVPIPKINSKQKIYTKQKKQGDRTKTKRPKSITSTRRLWKMHGM